jgi:hypothetical protein
MTTPWGLSTRIIDLEPGIAFALTAQHGGLIVTQDYAERNLSYPARRRALRFGDCYTYEMDCAWAIAIWELSHLWKSLGEKGKTGLESFTERQLAAIIEKRFPDYLGEYWALKSYALCRP